VRRSSMTKQEEFRTRSSASNPPRLRGRGGLILVLCALLPPMEHAAAEPARTSHVVVDRHVVLLPERNVELTITAAPAQLSLVPGTTSAVLAYNGQVPGPTLEFREGDHVVVHFRNRLD